MSRNDKKISILDLARNLQDTKEYQGLNWTGTFDDYLNLVRETPTIARNSFQRMYDMVLEAGTEDYIDAKKQMIHYKFFDDPRNEGKDAVFGLDISLMKLMNVIRSAALGYGTEKRVILLHGPVGSSKSTVCRMLKKGLEAYSKTDNGALYTFEWVDEGGDHEEIFGKGIRIYPSPMNEDPLWLTPAALREGLQAELNETNKSEYQIKIVGELCPPSRYIFQKLSEKYNGDLVRVFKHIRVKRLILSEADRIGIGTFQPKDEKNQDSTELTGDLNYRKIAEYGSDSDPRAFNFDGEFNIANRGMIEFVEMLKLDVAFLYDLLGASQEHMIKPKKFAQTYIDEVIIGHTNEPEYRKLQDNEFMEALRDRTVKIDIPYITKLHQETNIYKKDFNSRRLKGVSLAPHTLEMAAMWAILTRLEKPKKANVTRLQKLKLYDGRLLPNFTEDTIRELRKEAKREGFDGISPRYIQDKISNAIVMAQQNNKGSVNPFAVLNELEAGLKHHTLIASNNDDKKQDFRELIDIVRQEYEEIIKAEVQRAISADEAALQTLCTAYIENVKSFTLGDSVRNEFTGKDDVPDERLMRSVEEKIDIAESRKEDFRQEIMNYIGGLSLENRKFNYKSNPRLHSAFERKLFEDQKDTLNLRAVNSGSDDKAMLEKIELVKSRLIKEFGYDEISAMDVLSHVTSIFARGDVKEKNL